MPFKSEAQRRKFHAMAERGEMPESKVKEYEEATKGRIPERVGDVKKEAKRKARKKLMSVKRKAEAQSAASTSETASNA